MYQILSIILLMIFYGVYIGKMLAQKKQEFKRIKLQKEIRKNPCSS